MSKQLATILATDLKVLGAQIAELSLGQAKALGDYLRDAHGIKPAKPAVVPPPEPDEDDVKHEEPTRFDVVMTSSGSRKLEVIKALRIVASVSLVEARRLMEALPAKVKAGVSRDEAEQTQAALRQIGTRVQVQGLA